MLERLAATDTAGVGVAMVREWMQAAGLEVWPAPGTDPAATYLVGRAGGESGAKTLLTGVCHDPRLNALRYQGRAGFVVAIEVAQQLRHQGARPPFDLAVLAVPDDVRPLEAGSLLDDAAPHIWTDINAAGADAVDAQRLEIIRALRTAGLLEPSAVTLVRQGVAGGAHGAAGAFDAAAAGQAACALKQSLRCVSTAA